MFSFIQPDLRSVASTTGEALKSSIGNIVAIAKWITFGGRVYLWATSSSSSNPINATSTFDFEPMNNGTYPTCPEHNEFLDLASYALIASSIIGTCIAVGSAVAHHGTNLFHQHSSNRNKSHAHDDHCDHATHYDSVQDKESKVASDSNPDEEMQVLLYSVHPDEKSTVEKKHAKVTKPQQAALLLCGTSHMFETQGSLDLIVEGGIALSGSSPLTLGYEAAARFAGLGLGIFTAWGDYRVCSNSYEQLNEEEAKAKAHSPRKR